MCPSIGRTLEIDGVKQDSAGHFSCALKLNTQKLLHRYILDMRQNQPRLTEPPKRLELPLKQFGPSSADNISPANFSFNRKHQQRQQHQKVGTDASTAEPPNETGRQNDDDDDEESGNGELELVAPTTTTLNGNEWTNLSELIAKAGATNHTSSSRPFVVVVQTFSLQAVERSGKFLQIQFASPLFCSNFRPIRSGIWDLELGPLRF